MSKDENQTDSGGLPTGPPITTEGQPVESTSTSSTEDGTTDSQPDKNKDPDESSPTTLKLTDQQTTDEHSKESDKSTTSGTTDQTTLPDTVEDSMPLVYVSGPYRAPTEFGVGANVRRASGAALSLWRMGCAVICPHKNTLGWTGAPNLSGDGELDDSVWLDGDVIMLKRCDAVFMLPDWKTSEGAVIEHTAATEAEIPILYTFADTAMFLKQFSE